MMPGGQFYNTGNNFRCSLLYFAGLAAWKL